MTADGGSSARPQSRGTIDFESKCDGQQSTVPASTADCCEALGCTRSTDLRRVTQPGLGGHVLCPPHRKDFWGVST